MKRTILFVLMAAVLVGLPGSVMADFCSSVFEPVCGEDGRWYTNECFAENAGTTAREDGALILLEDNSGLFFFWSENDSFIDEAVGIADGELPNRIPVFNDLSAGPDCSQPHLFQVDPVDMVFADVAIELCDATAGYIDSVLYNWLQQVDMWCPWGGEIIDVWDYR